jgi:hypothetical protein
MSRPSAPDHAVINRPEDSRPSKERNPLWSVLLIIWALLVALLQIAIVLLWLINGEYICLDRPAWWGPPEDSEVYTSCSGHIDELLRK